MTDSRDDELREMYLQDAAPMLAEMVTGTWLDAQQFPPLEYAVPGIIPEGFGLLVGPPKAGKSWMVAAIGLAVAQGGVVLGRIGVSRRPVLYLALEDGHRRLQSRFRTINAGQPLPGIHVVTKAKPFQVIPMIDEYLGMFGEHKPLVILDTLGKAKPRRQAGADSYQEDYDYGARLKETVDNVPGSTLLAVHHSRKAESADFVDSVSGTHGITGAADFVIVLTRKRHEDNGLLSVTGRDISEAEYAVVTDNGLWHLDGTDLTDAARNAQSRREEGHLGGRALEVLALVNQSTVGTRASDVEKQIGMPLDQARVYLKRLVDSGRIKKIGRGLYSSVAAVDTEPSLSDSVSYVSSVTNGEESQLDGNVTNKTEITPLQLCGCSEPLTTEASIGAGRCSECALAGDLQ